jgi:hypothetical protein
MEVTRPAEAPCSTRDRLVVGRTTHAEQRFTAGLDERQPGVLMATLCLRE